MNNWGHSDYEVETDIFWNGIKGFEPTSILVWKELSKSSDLILDIGSNSGIYSLISKSVNNFSEVHAFEPIERVFKCLERNAMINNFNIITHNCAISNTDDLVTIYDYQDTVNPYSATLDKDFSKSFSRKVTARKIKAYSIDTLFFNEIKYHSKILIKIDVEKHEPEVLSGMLKIIDIFSPIILIEILSDEVGYRIEEILFKFNYFFYEVIEGNGLKERKNLTVNIKNYGKNFLLVKNKNLSEKIIKHLL
tara:strand:- start:1434 stop:2183 length:750 start_codon:yes stop_codon:yes gene_type:complete